MHQVAAQLYIHFENCDELDMLRPTPLLPILVTTLVAVPTMGQDGVQPDLIEMQYVPTDPKPAGNPGAWVTPADYPVMALRERREGVVRFKVAVNMDGRVTTCQITGSSGHSDLDEQTCKLIARRAFFRPATDPDGTAAAGFWSSAVRWEIPERSQAGPTQASLTTSFVIELDGSVSDCTAEGTGLRSSDQNSRCDHWTSRVFTPYKDANGNPVRKRVIMKNEVTLVDPSD